VNGAIVIFNVTIGMIDSTPQTALTTFDEIGTVVIDMEANHVASYCFNQQFSILK
jgi:hypothetical protein